MKTERVAVYAGSFDPITNGHLSIIEQASKMFDKVIVGVLINPRKTPLLQLDLRVEIIKDVLKDKCTNIQVKPFAGALVDFAEEENACAIVRGLRSISDFESELQLALTNRAISKNSIDTAFLVSDIRYQFVSSSMVKEVISLGKDASAFVPENIARLVEGHLKLQVLFK